MFRIALMAAEANPDLLRQVARQIEENIGRK
jgi:hypothetical protein